jgi:hypothetical protein
MASQVAGLNIAVRKTDRREFVLFENPPRPAFVDDRTPGALEAHSRFLDGNKILWRRSRGHGNERIVAHDPGESRRVDTGEHNGAGLPAVECFEFSRSKAHLSARHEYFIYCFEGRVCLMAQNVSGARAFNYLWEP